MRRVHARQRALVATAVSCLFIFGSLHHHQLKISSRKVPPGSPGWATTGKRLFEQGQGCMSGRTVQEIVVTGITSSLAEDLPVGIKPSTWSMFSRIQRSKELEVIEVGYFETADKVFQLPRAPSLRC